MLPLNLKWWICAAVMCCFTPVSSQTVHDILYRSDRYENLNEIDRLYYEALYIHHPDKVPAGIRIRVRDTEKCGFSLMSRVQGRWHEFNSHQQAMLASIGRIDFPFSYVSSEGLFKIHYDTSGVHGVSKEDLDHSGVPDYIEAAAAILDEVYDVEINQMGYRPPPDDLGLDGPELDVYIRNMSGVYGYILRDDQISSDPDIFSSSMYLDNDYTHTYTKGLNGLRVTAAHEFHHMIQLGYICRDDDRNGSCDDLFLMEALSTYIEDRVYDDINDYIHYLDLFFASTNVPFTTMGSNHEYGLCIWFHFLEAMLFDPDIARSVLEQVVFYPAVDALDQVLISRGSSFAEGLTLFYGWNYMTGDRADADRFYPEGDTYPMIKLDSVIPFYSDTALTVAVNAMASRYYQFQTEDEVYALIPVNINRDPGSTTKSGTLAIVYRDSSDVYTDLGNGIQARLTSNDPVPWKCASAIVPFPGEAELIVFDEMRDGSAGSISGCVWIDQNLDGIWQSTFESAVPEVAIELLYAGEDMLFDTGDDSADICVRTDGYGLFTVTELPAGYYRIKPDQATVPSGFELTTHNDPLVIYLTDGEIYDNANFGYHLPDLPVSIPNPFVCKEVSEIRLPFYMNKQGTVRLVIFNASGYHITEQENSFSAGIQYFSWRGQDNRGRQVPSGIYVYMIFGEQGLVRKGKFALIR